jgi:MYXO-CTERM domain-containing protein
MQKTTLSSARHRHAAPLPFSVCVLASLLLPTTAHALDWDHEDIKYGAEAPQRQWLNIYQTEQAAPAPIFLYAHENGSTADAMPKASADLIAGAGFTLVSWESIANIREATDTATAAADAALVFAWIREHAATYDLDPDRIIIGGRSRGSGISWSLAHSEHPSVIGLYFYNALPDEFWGELMVSDPLADISPDSPPMHLVYGPAPEDDDPHSPTNAYPVIDRYTELGIGGRVKLTDSMNADGLTPFHYFPALAARLTAPTAPTAPDRGDSEDTPARGCSTTPDRTGGGWWLLLLGALRVRRRA